MRVYRIRRALSFMGALGVALVLLPCEAAGRPDAGAFTRAADAVIAGLDSQRGQSPLPVADARVQALLVASKPALDDARSDMMANPDVCSSVKTVLRTYLMAGVDGLEQHADESAVDLKKRQLDRVGKNLVAYQDVVMPFEALAMQCIARTSDSHDVELQAMPKNDPPPVAMEAIRQLRQMSMTALADGIGMSTASDVPQVTLSNKRTLLNSVSANAPTLASVMLPKQRDQMRAVFAKAAAAGPREFRAQIEKLDQVFVDRRCVLFCAFGE